MPAPTLSPETTIARLLEAHPELLAVLVEAHPHFRQLRHRLLRRVMAPRLTLAQAARIAGIPTDALLDRLRAALGEPEPGEPAGAEPTPWPEGMACPSGTPREPVLTPERATAPGRVVPREPAVTPGRTAAAEPGVPAEPEAPSEPAVTLERAAAVAPAAPPAEPMPVPAARPVWLDVREDIRQGREPFVRIMAAVKALPEDAALVLRAPFEPIPLYDVLGRRGFAHRTERHAADDWQVWFYREGRPPAPAAAAPSNPAAETAPIAQTAPAAQPAAAVQTATVGLTSRLDVRGLEPPEPMVQVLAQLETLRPDQTLEVLHDRRPLFLYPQLDERGFVHETDEPAPGLVRIVIRRGRR